MLMLIKINIYVYVYVYVYVLSLVNVFGYIYKWSVVICEHVCDYYCFYSALCLPCQRVQERLLIMIDQLSCVLSLISMTVVRQSTTCFDTMGEVTEGWESGLR